MTPALLHGNLVHLAMNCFSLHNVGPPVERILGWERMLGVYAFSALSGSAFSYWFNPAPAVGASGAIFGLLGCLTAFHVKYERQLGEAGKYRLRRARARREHTRALAGARMPVDGGGDKDLLRCTELCLSPLRGCVSARVRRSLAQMAGMNLLLGLMSRNVDNFAHVGGFLGGAALTLALC